MTSIFNQIEDFNEYSSDFVISSQTFLRRNVDKFPDVQRFVISSESLVGNCFSGYANSDVIAKMLAEIAEGFSVKIILYLRRQDQFLESLYVHLVERGKIACPFQEYLDSLGPDAFNWKNLVDAYAAQFGAENVIVRTYDSALLASKGLLADFSEIIGIQKLDYLEANNRSSMGAIMLQRKVNACLDMEAAYIVRRLLQLYNQEPAMKKLSLFSGAQRSKFVDRYSSSNNAVSLAYGNRHFEPVKEEPGVREKKDGDSFCEDECVALSRVVFGLMNHKKFDVRRLMEDSVGINKSLNKLRKIPDYLRYRFRRLF